MKEEFEKWNGEETIKVDGDEWPVEEFSVIKFFNKKRLKNDIAWSRLFRLLRSLPQQALWHWYCMDIFDRFLCNHKFKAYVAHKTRNGSIQLQKQCFVCCEVVDQAIPHRLAKPPVLRKYERKDRSNWYRLNMYKKIMSDRLPYSDYLNGAFGNWREIRNRVIERDGHCVRCGDIGSDVHHKHYENIFRERLEDLEFLCRSCHEEHHRKEQISSPFDYPILDLEE